VQALTANSFPMGIEKVGSKNKYEKTQKMAIRLSINTVIKQDDVSDILFLCSLVKADNIPQSLFIGYFQKKYPKVSTSDIGLKIRKAVEILQKESLLRREFGDYEKKQTVYHIHRTVQKISLEIYKDNCRKKSNEMLLKPVIFFQNVILTIKEISFANQSDEICRNLTMHIESFIFQVEKIDKEVYSIQQKDKTLIYNIIGETFLKLGKHQSALEFFKKIPNSYKKRRRDFEFF
jgi:hypothetical protein